MECEALWYGGCNYAAPTTDDIEFFTTIRKAKSAFERRLNDGHYPCVDRNEAEMHLFFHEWSDNGPDRILRCGPRGGVITERA